MTKQSQHNSDGFDIKDLQDHLFTLMHVRGVGTNAQVLLEVKPGEQAPNYHNESVRLKTLREVVAKLTAKLDLLDDAAYGAVATLRDDIEEEADAIDQRIQTWTRFMGGTAYCPLTTITVLSGDNSPGTNGDPVLLLGVSE